MISEATLWRNSVMQRRYANQVLYRWKEKTVKNIMKILKSNMLLSIENPQMDLQTMDRCHRIRQTKPVHVYRLATTQSVEVQVLKRAFSNLRLEHVVIAKGQLQQERPKTDDEVLEGVTSIIVGTIIAIHEEEGWWYIGCRACKKKVIRSADIVDLEADMPKKVLMVKMIGSAQNAMSMF